MGGLFIRLIRTWSKPKRTDSESLAKKQAKKSQKISNKGRDDSVWFVALKALLPYLKPA
ncbi:MAG: hypothetical protein ACJAVI_003577 [Candidatus Azotimanducaceae bacterium]